MAAYFEASTTQLADVWPRFYFRLINDGFFIWEYGLAALSVFQHEMLSCRRPSIFLDVVDSKRHPRDTQCIPYSDVYAAKNMYVPGDLVPIVFSTFQLSLPVLLHVWVPVTDRSVENVIVGTSGCT
jgi:hypothetical protein